MSRIGAKPVPLPAGVTAAVDGSTIKIKGPKGELAWTCAPGIAAEAEPGRIVVRAVGQGEQIGALHGTTRSLVANMVKGVTEGYVRDLEIQGVGYRAQAQGQKLVLNVGYSHPIEFPVPAGIKVEVADGTKLKVSGIDKHLVGEVSAQIRAFHKAEPYKGKGIRYVGEYVRRKAGKTVA